MTSGSRWFRSKNKKRSDKCQYGINLTFVSTMLVGYSSSSEEENDPVVQDGKRPAEEDDGCSARKKPKTQGEVPKTRSINCSRGPKIYIFFKTKMWQNTKHLSRELNKS